MSSLSRFGNLELHDCSMLFSRLKSLFKPKPTVMTVLDDEVAVANAYSEAVWRSYLDGTIALPLFLPNSKAL